MTQFRNAFFHLSKKQWVTEICLFLSTSYADVDTTEMIVDTCSARELAILYFQFIPDCFV